MNVPEKQAQLHDAAVRLFSSPAGEIILNHLNNFCQADLDNFAPDNERINCYMQGRRSVALEIRRIIALDVK